MADEIDALRAAMRGTLDGIAAEAGLPTLHPFTVAVKKIGDAVTIDLTRRPHHSEGHFDERAPSLPGGPLPSRQRLESWMRRFVRDYQMLLARDRAVEAAGGDPLEPPAWAYDVHPVIRALMTHVGVDPERLVIRGRNRVRDSNGTKSEIQRTTTSVRSDRDEILKGIDRNAVTALVAETRRDQIHVPTLTIPLTKSMNLSVRDTTDTVIDLAGDDVPQLPETIRQALAGRPLADAFSHAALDPLGLTIKRSVAIAKGMRFVLETKRTPLADAPAGTDLSWRKSEAG